MTTSIKGFTLTTALKRLQTDIGGTEEVNSGVQVKPILLLSLLSLLSKSLLSMSLLSISLLSKSLLSMSLLSMSLLSSLGFLNRREMHFRVGQLIRPFATFQSSHLPTNPVSHPCIFWPPSLSLLRSSLELLLLLFSYLVCSGSLRSAL